MPPPTPMRPMQPRRELILVAAPRILRAFVRPCSRSSARRGLWGLLRPVGRPGGCGRDAPTLLSQLRYIIHSEAMSNSLVVPYESGVT
jgi:hypothetical protein